MILKIKKPIINHQDKKQKKERRKFNKQNKTTLSLQDFALAYAVKGAQKGEDISWLRPYLDPNMLPHKDNWDLFPNGTNVRLNYEQIMARPEKYMSQQFKNWVDNNKEEVFTVYRDTENPSNNRGLVTLHYLDETRDTEESLTWLFDMYSDILVWSKEFNDYVDPQKVEDLSNEIANTKESFAIVTQLFGEEIPEDILPTINEISDKIDAHDNGEAYISNVVDWQNMDNELRVIIEDGADFDEEETEETEETEEDQEEIDEETTPETVVEEADQEEKEPKIETNEEQGGNN